MLLMYWIYINVKKKQDLESLNSYMNADDPQLSTEWVDQSNSIEFPKEHPQIKFQWEHVKSCLNNVLDKETFKHYKSCPNCGRVSDQLTWIRFSSPKDTWQNLCGTSGPLSICTKCDMQVEYINEVMN